MRKFRFLAGLLALLLACLLVLPADAGFRNRINVVTPGAAVSVQRGFFGRTTVHVAAGAPITGSAFFAPSHAGSYYTIPQQTFLRQRNLILRDPGAGCYTDSVAPASLFAARGFYQAPARDVFRDVDRSYYQAPARSIVLRDPGAGCYGSCPQQAPRSYTPAVAGQEDVTERTFTERTTTRTQQQTEVIEGPSRQFSRPLVP